MWDIKGKLYTKFQYYNASVVGRLKGWASVLLKRKVLAHEDSINTAGRKRTAHSRPD